MTVHGDKYVLDAGKSGHARLRTISEIHDERTRALLLDAGADILAVIEGVFGAADVRAAAGRYARLFSQHP